MTSFCDTIKKNKTSYSDTLMSKDKYKIKIGGLNLSVENKKFLPPSFSLSIYFRKVSNYKHFKVSMNHLKNYLYHLASVAHLVGVSSHILKVCRFDSVQGTCLGCWSHPKSRCICFHPVLMFFSLSVSFPSLLSKINERVLE